MRAENQAGGFAVVEAPAAATADPAVSLAESIFREALGETVPLAGKAADMVMVDAPDFSEVGEAEAAPVLGPRVSAQIQAAGCDDMFDALRQLYESQMRHAQRRQMELIERRELERLTEPALTAEGQHRLGRELDQALVCLDDIIRRNAYLGRDGVGRVPDRYSNGMSLGELINCVPARHQVLAVAREARRDL